MNKKFMILSLLGSAGVVAVGVCSAIPGFRIEAVDAEAAIKKLLGHFQSGYRAIGSYEMSVDYPSEVASVDYTTSGSFTRDYAFMKEEDGTLTNAVREILPTGELIHFEGEDGAALQETLNAQNEVDTIREQEYLADVLYAEKYLDPWDYVTPADLVYEDGVFRLSPDKATFFIDEYFGLGFSAKEAEITVMNGYPSRLEFTLEPRVDGLEITTATGFTVLSVVTTLTASIDFSFSFPPFEHLEPLAYESPELEAALKASSEANSYALRVSSNAVLSDAIYYVTPDGVYYHAAADTPYSTSGDRYYAKGRRGYDEYRYDGSAWSSRVAVHDDLSSILPGYSKVIPAQYRADGEGVYALDDRATVLNASSILPSIYAEGLGDGIAASLLIEDGKLSKALVSAGISTFEVATTLMWDGYGTTVFPSFFNPEVDL